MSSGNNEVVIRTVGDLRCLVQSVRQDMLRIRMSRSDKLRPEEPEMVVVSPLPVIPMRVTEAEGTISVSGGGLVAIFDPCDGCFSVDDQTRGQVLKTKHSPGWRSVPEAIQAHPIGREAHMGDGRNYVRRDDDVLHQTLAESAFALSVKAGSSEHFYGLGMTGGAVELRGRIVDTWIDHYGADDYRTPYFWSSAGYSIFVRTSRAGKFDMAATDSEAVTIWIDEDDEFECFIQTGSLSQCLEGYTWLTGRSPMIPEWAFGTWMGGYWENQEALLAAARRYRELDIPVEVMRLDSQWQKDHECDFKWDSNFSDPAAMIAELNQMGFKLHLWCAHLVNYNCEMFPTGLQDHHYVKNQDNSVPLIKWWKPHHGCMIDFTRPESRDWWKSLMRPVLKSGVAGFKTDGANESNFATHLRKFADGRTGRDVHNIYPLIYAACVSDLQREVHGEYTPIWIRSGYAGIQRYPIMWAGDQDANWKSILVQVRAGISAGLSGVCFWASDGGGFGGRPDEELYIRGIQFAFWNPICQPFGRNRDPWFFGERAVRVFRHYARLREMLRPYLLRIATESTQFGIPMMRHMCLEFPGDDACRCLDDQFMLGPDFLVAPILDASGFRNVYLPEGGWIDINNRKLLNGSGWHEARPGIERIPVYVREGTGEIERLDAVLAPHNDEPD